MVNFDQPPPPRLNSTEELIDLCDESDEDDVSDGSLLNFIIDEANDDDDDDDSNDDAMSSIADSDEYDKSLFLYFERLTEN